MASSRSEVSVTKSRSTTVRARLHGGTVGFDRKVWTPATSSGPGTVSLKLTYVSVDGEMGFPGTLTTIATYTLDNENRLTLTFHATTTADTVVNLTSHTYWNLAGEFSGSVYGQMLYINANSFTPVDSALLPTGAIEPVAGTPFDFTKPTAIGQNIDGGPQFGERDNQELRICKGYDLNWVLNQTSPPSLILAARAWDPSSGRELSVLHDPTRPPVLFGQCLDRDACRHERPPPERRIRAGDPALPGLPESARTSLRPCFAPVRSTARRRSISCPIPDVAAPAVFTSSATRCRHRFPARPVGSRGYVLWTAGDRATHELPAAPALTLSLDPSC